MIKARKASVLVIGAMAVVAIGGGVAFAASGGDDPIAPSRASVTDALAPEAAGTDGLAPEAAGTDGLAPEAAETDGLGPEAAPGTNGLGPEAAAPGSPEAAATGSPSTATGTGDAAGGISAAVARAIAVRAAGGGRVTKVERETEHGRAVWDVEVRAGGVEHDIDVDRRTGAVLRHETDASGRDDRGGRDDRADDNGHDRGDDHGGRGRGGDDD